MMPAPPSTGTALPAPVPLLTPDLVIAARPRAGDPILPPATIAAAEGASNAPDLAKHDVIILTRTGGPDRLAARFIAAGHRVIRVAAADIPPVAQAVAVPLPALPKDVLERDALLLEILGEIRRQGHVDSAVLVLDVPDFADAAVRARERWNWRIVVTGARATLSPRLERVADLLITDAAGDATPSPNRGPRPAPAIAADVPWADLAAAVRATWPLASIIVVSFNTLAFTRLCVASVLANTEYPNYELILIDNGSTDGSAAALTDLGKQYPHVRIILNDTNQGFGPANNQGLIIARGDLLVLLNSDTMTPPGWLSRLAWHLTDPRLGMIGPSTNRTCNEAQVATAYSTYGELLAFARQRGDAFDGQRHRIRMPMMFCAAWRRDVLADVGLLDERYETGMFEDEDYALRVQAAGYETAWAADTYVHHAYHASIGKLLTSGEYLDLFRRNQARFEEKWGICWERHRLPRRPAPAAPANPV